MKTGFFILLFSVFFRVSVAQSCSSQRYIDTIFHQVTVTSGIYFATATPYGLLAQPQDLYLDFYEPTGDTLAHRPLIVFQFGGGFVIGWRSEPDIPQFCQYFAQCGYAVASIDYRIGLNPADTNSTVRAYYRGVQDERSAIRFLCQRADSFRIDTANIILTGTSAGCFCALANAFTSDSDRPACTFGSALEPDDLGCMDCSGNSDFGRRIPHIKAIINQWGAILDTSYIQAPEQTPVVSFHGDQDVLVPYNYGYPFQLPVFPEVYGSAPIHQRLNHLGITNELHTLVGYGHEPELLAPNLNDTIYNYSRKFLYPLLQPHTEPIAGPTQVCLSTQAVYSVPYTAGSRYCWQLNGNGTLVQDNGNSIKVLWSDTGSVSVSVKEINAIDAEGNIIHFFTQVIPDVQANFGYSINQLEVEISNWSAHADNFFWSFGDGTFSTDTNPVKNYQSGGSYPIVLVASNASCSDTFRTTLTVDSCPKADFTSAVNGHNGFFNASPTNTTSYHWYFGDGDSAFVNNPNVLHVYQQDGVYEIILSVSNVVGCKAADTTTVQIQTTGINSVSGTRFLVRRVQKDEVEIQSTSHSPFQILLFDINGEMIVSKDANALAYLSLTGLAKGIYLLQINSTDTSLQQKIRVY